MAKMLTFVLGISLNKKDMEDLGIPEKISKKELVKYSDMMARLLTERDFRPLMRRAADAMGYKTKVTKSKDLPRKKLKSQALLRKANRQGGLAKSRLLHPLHVSTPKTKRTGKES